MWPYLVKRILRMIPTLVGAALLVFLLMNVDLRDIALPILGSDAGGDFNIQEAERLREKLGLTRPLHKHFFAWLWGIVRLDFGTSLWSGTQ